MHAQGILFAVMSIRVDYRAPARLDDELEITCAPRAAGATSLHFAQQIYRGGDAAVRGLLADADVRIVCVDATSFRPKRLPQFVLDAVAGEAASNG
jgi:acyl-CoA thioester hydrolase